MKLKKKTCLFKIKKKSSFKIKKNLLLKLKKNLLLKLKNTLKKWLYVHYYTMVQAGLYREDVKISYMPHKKEN